MATSHVVLDISPLPDLTPVRCAREPDAVRPHASTKQAPASSHREGQEFGDWQFFCRLLLWATRNNHKAKK
jgi:hypothetical protein